MAEYRFSTGVSSHPTIVVTDASFANNNVTFRWEGAAYSGQCLESFEWSTEALSGMTIEQIMEEIAQQMIAKLGEENVSS